MFRKPSNAQSNKEKCVCAFTIGSNENAYINFSLDQFHPSFVQCEHANFTQVYETTFLVWPTGHLLL